MSESTKSYGGGIVNFKAGARTAWHTHPVGQILIVISGRGRVQSEGEPIHEIFPGDVVWIPGNEPHWHSAAPDHAISHVAISELRNGSTVTWSNMIIDLNIKQHKAIKLIKRLMLWPVSEREH